MIRALLVCPEFPPYSIGGGGEVFSALARELPKHDIELTVLAGNYRGYTDTQIHNGVTVHGIPLVKTPAATPFLRTTLPPTPAGIKTVREVLGRQSFDVAHLHGVSFTFIDAVAHRLKRLGIPWLFTLHGAPRTPARLPFPFGALYRTYFQFYGRTVIRDAAARTAVSAAAARFPLVAGDMQPFEVVPNGIDLSSLHGDEEAPAGWPDSAAVLLSIGRLEPAKGFDRVIRALPDISGGHYVILGGDGGSQRELRVLAEQLRVADRVHFLGHAGPGVKRYALRRAKLCMIPSRNESFGIVALEAMAAGVPIVTSGAEGLDELFGGDLRRSVAGADPRDISERSRVLLDDAEERDMLIAAGLQRVQEYLWSTIAQSYADVYRRIARGT